MPWKESKALDQRKSFIQEWEKEQDAFEDLENHRRGGM